MALARLVYAGEDCTDEAQPGLAPDAVTRKPVPSPHEAVGIRRGLKRAHHCGADRDDARTVSLRLVDDRCCPL